MTAPHPIASLKAGLRATLLADATLSAVLGGAVYDAPPRGQTPPYLVLGDAIARDNATNDADGRMIDLDLVVQTSERGSSQALNIAAAIEASLNSVPLTLDGHRLIALVLRETLVRQDIAQSLTRATLKLRAFTEPL